MIAGADSAVKAVTVTPECYWNPENQKCVLTDQAKKKQIGAIARKEEKKKRCTSNLKLCQA